MEIFIVGMAPGACARIAGGAFVRDAEPKFFAPVCSEVCAHGDFYRFITKSVTRSIGTKGNDIPKIYRAHCNDT